MNGIGPGYSIRPDRSPIGFVSSTVRYDAKLIRRAQLIFWTVPYKLLGQL
jgi:hypothetical protein